MLLFCWTLEDDGFSINQVGTMGMTVMRWLMCDKPANHRFP